MLEISMNLNSVSGLIGRAMPHDRDSPHHAPYKDAHHIRGSISQGNSPSLLQKITAWGRVDQRHRMVDISKKILENVA